MEDTSNVRLGGTFIARDCIAATLSHLEAARASLEMFATEADYAEHSDALPRCCDVLDGLDGHCEALAAILYGGQP